MQMDDLPDRRALGLPEQPYSAYCRVCWQPVYAFWIDSEPHRGECVEGARVIGGCRQALDWEQAKGERRKYLARSA